MKKMYINYIFNTCTEVFATAEEAVKRALEENQEGEYVYLNHYVDEEKGLDAWEAFIADGDMGGTRYVEKEDWDGLGYWEDGWDNKAEITVIKEPVVRHKMRASPKSR